MIVYAVFNLPFAVWMLRGFIREIPVEIEEAAMIDGCLRLRTFRRVLLPLMAPGMVSTFVFCFYLRLEGVLVCYDYNERYRCHSVSIARERGSTVDELK